ncbi:protein kinase [Anaerolineales bacterium HSG25]|nr:protein kinase [Anaerolineales bacterium HSG25]
MIGDTIDSRYRVEAVIGRGGMGAVYRASDLTKKEQIALKFLHIYLDIGSDTAITRFQREFRVLTQLHHPGIVQAYDYGTYKDVPYLSLEFLAGETLADRLKKGPLSRHLLLQIAQQITDALIYLHNKSIVHRDLKPGNLMLLPPHDSPRIKLMDFGLVRASNLSQQLTQEGTALGTVAYMSPEQAQALPIDFRADLYALGVILYEMTSGRTPFVHENPAMMLMQQLTATPPPPSRFNPEIDEALEQFILKLLEKEPSDRPSSTEAVHTKLARLADNTAPILVQSAKRVDIIPRLPLIGQNKLLQQLNQHWSHAHAGEGQVVLLSGVAGSGKTRLLTEARVQVRLDGGKYIRTTCREHASLPYQPLIDALAEIPADQRHELPPEVACMLPEASSSGPEIISSDPAQARLRIFGIFWDMLSRKASERPMMFIFEDIQWADPTTLELIGYLVRQVHQIPFNLILSYRQEELEKGTPLAKLLHELKRNKAIHHLNVALLNRDQVATFLKAALSQTKVPDWLVDSFHLATDGNPLFIEETLKALAAEGKVNEWTHEVGSQSVSMPSMTLQLPQNVLALAERRLQLLSDEDRTTLTAAAVLGPEFTFGLLEGITRMDEDDLLDTIDRLLAARLIEELPLMDGDDRYRFNQEALRQALLGNISQRRKRRLHQKAGQTMQTIYDTNQAHYWPSLAYHFAEGGDQLNAIKYSTMAGDAATKVYAYQEATVHYSQSITLLAQQPSSSEYQTKMIDLYSKRGRNLELNGQHEAAYQVYLELEALGDERNESALKLAGLLAQTPLHSTPTPLNDVHKANELAQQALTLARDIGDRVAEAKALWNLELVHSFLQKPYEAIEYAEQSIAISRELGLTEQLAYALNDSQLAYISTKQMEKARAAIQEAHILWEQLNNMPMLIDCLSSFGIDAYLSGNYEECLSISAEIRRLSELSDNKWGQVYGRWMLGYIYFDYGETEKAMTAIRETIEIGEAGGFVAPGVSQMANLGRIYTKSGAVERGAQIIAKARQKMDDTILDIRLELLSITAYQYALQGDMEKADQAFQESVQGANTEQPHSLATLWIGLVNIELELMRHQYETALAKVNRYISQSKEWKVRPFMAGALYFKGQALLSLNRVNEAYEALTSARQEAEALNIRRFLWQILALLSQLERERGNQQVADALHQQAREILTFIIDHLPDDIKDDFLALPDVRVVRE